MPTSCRAKSPINGATGCPSSDSVTKPSASGVRVADHQRSGVGNAARPASAWSTASATPASARPASASAVRAAIAALVAGSAPLAVSKFARRYSGWPAWQCQHSRLFSTISFQPAATSYSRVTAMAARSRPCGASAAAKSSRAGPNGSGSSARLTNTMPPTSSTCTGSSECQLRIDCHAAARADAPLQVVRPLVVGTDEPSAMAGRPAAHARAAVAADVVERAQRAVLTAHDRDGVGRDLERDPVAGLGQLAAVAGEEPAADPTRERARARRSPGRGAGRRAASGLRATRPRAPGQRCRSPRQCVQLLRRHGPHRLEHPFLDAEARVADPAERGQLGPVPRDLVHVDRAAP